MFVWQFYIDSKILFIASVIAATKEEAIEKIVKDSGIDKNLLQENEPLKTDNVYCQYLNVEEL